MSFDMDAYYEAHDMHGEEVECDVCGMPFDSLYCDHYNYRKCDCPGCEEVHAYPLCDACYWSEWYRTHDPETGIPYEDMEWRCPECGYDLEEAWLEDDNGEGSSYGVCDNCGHKEQM